MLVYRILLLQLLLLMLSVIPSYKLLRSFFYLPKLTISKSFSRNELPSHS